MYKLMVVFTELFHGGAEKQFRELVSRIDKNVFEIVGVSSGVHGGKEDDKNVIDFKKKNPEIRYYFLDRIYAPKKILNKVKVSLDFNKQISSIVEFEKPDIIICYNGIELSASYVYKKSGAKVIFSERESGDRGLLKLWRYRYYFRNVDSIICNSKQAQRFYKSKGIESGYIPNGIDENDILEKVKKDTYNIVVPARIAKVKNQELVIEAIKDLDIDNIKITFIGKHEDKEYLSHLYSLVEKYDLVSKVFFLKFTENIKSIYRDADLVILPSKMEGLTNVLLESYMFGRICLMSDIIMNRDIANQNQRFFGVNDSHKLHDLICEMINRDDKINEQEIIDNHIYVEKKFSMNTMVEAYKQLFLNQLEA